MMEWVEVDPEDVPSMPTCPKGFTGHRLVLSIEEGNVTFGLADGEECPEYEGGPVCLFNQPDGVLFEMEPVPVTVAYESECPGRGACEMGSHYIDHSLGGACDCNHWFRVTPLYRDESGDT